jgi:hypothetical protein
MLIFLRLHYVIVHVMKHLIVREDFFLNFLFKVLFNHAYERIERRNEFKKDK